MKSFRWYSAQKFFAQPLPSPIWRWLQQAHLTQAICSQYQHQLQVISQGQSKILFEEAQLLPEDSNPVWIREICHIGDNQPLVYARVTVPNKTYQEFADDFNALQNRPIGDTLLFKNPDVLRSTFHYALIHDAAPFYEQSCKLLGLAPEFYARYSLFTWKTYPLLITEIFTPDLKRWKTIA